MATVAAVVAVVTEREIGVRSIESPRERRESQVEQGRCPLDERTAPHARCGQRQHDRGSYHEQTVPADDDEPGVRMAERGEGECRR